MGNTNLKASDLNPDNFQGKSNMSLQSHPLAPTPLYIAKIDRLTPSLRPTNQ